MLIREAFLRGISTRQVGRVVAIVTVLHQRCWVHKMRNIRDRGRVRDRDELKQMAQAIYLAEDRRAGRAAFRRFKLRWQADYPTMVKQLEKDLPALLSFFSFPKQLWQQLRTTNIIERCFVEVRGRTRPMIWVAGLCGNITN